MLKIARLIVGAEPAIVVAIAPALLFPTPARMLVLVAVPVVWISCLVAGERLVARTPLNGALAGLAAMTAISLWVSYDPLVSLGKVAGVVLGLLWFAALARWMTTTRRVEAAMAAFQVCGAALAVVGLLGTRWPDKFDLLRRATERLPEVIRGLPGAESGFNPNAVSGCLILFLPLQLLVLLSMAERRARVPAWRMTGQALMVVLTGGTIALMQSRGAWAGLGCAAAMVVAFRTERRRLVIRATAAVAALVACAVVVFKMIVAAGTSTDAVRPTLWRSALYAIHDFPLTGMGLNVFRRAMPVLYPAAWTSVDSDVSHAHNAFLQVAVDLGLPALAAYLAMWIIVGGLLVQVWRFSGTPGECRLFALGLGAGLIAHLVFGLEDTIPLGAKIGVFWWFALALVVGVHRLARIEAQTGSVT